MGRGKALSHDVRSLFIKKHEAIIRAKTHGIQGTCMEICVVHKIHGRPSYFLVKLIKSRFSSYFYVLGIDQDTLA